MDRIARRSIPDDRRLALVGDPNRRNLVCFDARLGESAARGAKLTFPDLQRIVLDPTGIGEMLRKFVAVFRRDAPIALEEDGAR